MEPIFTERLILREFTLADADDILALLTTPDFIRNIGDRGVKDLESAHSYLKDGPLQSYREHGFGLWRIGLAGDDRFIGTCGLIRRDTLPAVDIGYALLPEFYGQGFAIEAARACMAMRRDFGLAQVIAIVAKDNLPSQRLLEKLGLQFSGHIPFGEPAVDVRLYKLLSD
ncbi:GNAT family N-acetyltransferase [Shewanella zhangzhouensis]|uniref:GNAT family N-acetyltransferase n=1 Tax=Shewanella zhangzhouensis TaxID=2864213 RepID=UPI001C659071|nr:GNAT family N-acetyltransferase [Shewanella zhangzhouensis]QYK06710.1 GNAT family N-acetyltransferase [Shewanella zhangzhouensis]